MKIKICAFSDTHSMHEQVTLPECDIAIFAGDLSQIGEYRDVASFLNWYNNQVQCTRKVYIAGNHDRHGDPKFNNGTKADTWWEDLRESYDGLTYLEDNCVYLFNLKIWGSPITPWYYGDRWAFNKHRGDEINETWKKIPKDADIVVTHGPCSYILDYVPKDDVYVGCEQLRYRIEEIKPKFHICGHIHEGYGTVEKVDTTFVNASICNGSYHPINKPIEFEIDV